MPKTKKQITAIVNFLKAAYPNVKTQLTHKNPFELLVATILSAQCTDKQVNAVTETLFQKLPTPRDMAAAPLPVIESLIRSTGFYHNKAKHIQSCAQALLSDHNGQVPRTLEALVTLPGVGRKTANVVLGAAFGMPGIVVDTHVARLSQRIGLTRHTDPVKIEFDLMNLLPKTTWNDFCLHLIYHGRAVCTARKPKCLSCMLLTLCDYPKNNPVPA
ncbi:MAG: endonuclease III [Desulfobacterales bacterium]|jgi:endonuclease-3|nr:endonuclease III [Desulfobacterales bacterium]